MHIGTCTQLLAHIRVWLLLCFSRRSIPGLLLTPGSAAARNLPGCSLRHLPGRSQLTQEPGRLQELAAARQVPGGCSRPRVEHHTPRWEPTLFRAAPTCRKSAG